MMMRTMSLSSSLAAGLLLAVTVFALAAEENRGATTCQKLDQPLEMTFSDQPLSDVLAYMAAKLEVQIHIQWRRLEDVGIGREETVSIQLKEVPGSTALELLLDQVGDGALSYYVRDNLVVLTSMEEAANWWRPQVFFVSDLIAAPPAASGMANPTMPGMMPGMGLMGSAGADMSSGYPGGPPAKQPREELLDFITSAIAPNSWEESGGHGTIDLYRGFLVVKHAPRVQKEVGQLLDAMREVRGQQPGAAAPGQMPGVGPFPGSGQPGSEGGAPQPALPGASSAAPGGEGENSAQ